MKPNAISAASPRGASLAPRRPIDTAAVVTHPLLRRLYRFVQPAVERVFGFPGLAALHADATRSGRTGAAFATAVLDRLDVRWGAEPGSTALLRARPGPIVVVCNHPFGGLDALALMPWLESIRPGGWRLLANAALCSLPEFGPNLIPVDSLGRSPESRERSRQGLAAALRHLRAGGVLALFPAGRVSHWRRDLRALCDRPWSDHAVRLAARTGAALACVHLAGGNSRRFLAVPPAWSGLRALMLARELLHPPVRDVTVRIAAITLPEAVARLAAGPTPAARLQATCFLRSDRDRPRPPAADAVPPPALAAPEDPAALQAEVAGLPASCRLLALNDGDIELLLVRGEEVPCLLRELGRCRERTFRAAGQGVGRARDLAPEDRYYHHLIAWRRAPGAIVGAYRLGLTREIVATRGVAGLYLGRVFRLHPALLARLGPAIELSRSFVIPECQRDNQVLALLWRGLGAAAIRHGCGTFFGSVSLSNDHHPATRAILVEHLRRRHADSPDLCRLVRARRPFRPETRYHRLVADAYAGQPLEALGPLVEAIEEGRRGIPPLMRYYCSLGAKFLAYHVEAEFQNALYCLLRVDLAAMPPGYRRRFLGEPPNAGRGLSRNDAVAVEPPVPRRRTGDGPESG